MYRIVLGVTGVSGIFPTRREGDVHVITANGTARNGTALTVRPSTDDFILCPGEEGSVLHSPIVVGSGSAAHDEPDRPQSDFPEPRVLSEKTPFLWDDDAPQSQNYTEFGQRLAESGDLFRQPHYGSGLLMASSSPQIPPKPIIKGSQLAPVIADRLRVLVFKNGKPAGSMPSTTHLNTMLASELFLQQFPPLDMVVHLPLYLPGFVLIKPGYNDGGPGQRIYHVGRPPVIAANFDPMNRFLDVMAFDSNADRTNAVGAALTVLLRNHWLGAKPILVVTSTKSHGGKDTIIEFAAGRTPHASLSYEQQDWALQKNFAAMVQHNPNLGVINIENVRVPGKDARLESSFLERLLTDPEPVISATGTGSPNPRKNNLVLAASTNFGKISEDLMNRALPIHLVPVGDVSQRKSAIGNPRLEYLPANCNLIEGGLLGMVERWIAEGQPLDHTAKHPFSVWAPTVGGILKVAGFDDFLGNYNSRQTEDDPVRHALGLLGADQPNVWMRTEKWALVAANLGLVNQLISPADRSSAAGRQRGLGVVFSAQRDVPFEVETEDAVITTTLRKARKRSGGGEVETQYMFELVKKEKIPVDGE